MAGERRLHRDLGGLGVANLTDHDHIGVLAHYRAQSVRKRQTDLRLDVDLMNGDKAIWYRFPKSVRITAKWGYSTTPPQEIRQATIIQVTRWFKRAQQAYQDTGAILELGQLRYVRELDPDVSLIIDHYRRVTV